MIGWITTYDDERIDQETYTLIMRFNNIPVAIAPFEDTKKKNFFSWEWGWRRKPS
jgi:hypothetical protein